MKVKDMRSGYTTGSCASAGMKAALLSLLQQKQEQAVVVLSPQEVQIRVPIERVEVLSSRVAKAVVIKDGGDDPDITHGVPITTEVELTDRPGLVFQAGEGVGIVTKPGLSIPVGEPAINPGPRQMMQRVYEELVPLDKGLIVTVSVENGRALATKTLNPVLGVEGGISIIGTSGIVKPMSEEGFKDSLVPQLTVIKASGLDTVVLTPGRIGMEAAVHWNVDRQFLAETSNFIGFMLEKSVETGLKNIVLLGHLGKLVKVASGSFHTHNRMSDGRMETLVAYAGMNGASAEVMKELYQCLTTEAAMDIIAREGLECIYGQLAERAAQRASRYIYHEAKVGVIFITLEGKVLAMDQNAKDIGGAQSWNLPSM